MERVPEPHQLMEDDEQARAYAEANFEEPHANFVRRFAEYFPDYEGTGLVLDLGCGPADITLRFARRYPKAVVHGVDGSAAMLRYGQRALSRAEAEVSARVTLVEGFIPGAVLPAAIYDAVICNNLLHHLPDAQTLWTTLRKYSRAGTKVLIGDLYRPASPEAARQIVETYSAGEPEPLKTDFYNSLLAAFSPEEAEAGLAAAGLSSFNVNAVTDRHLVIYGVVP